MPIQLTPETARRLQKLIRQDNAPSFLFAQQYKPTGSSAREARHVRYDGGGTGTVLLFNSSNFSWEEYAQVYLLAGLGQQLTVDRVYLCLEYGALDTVPVFVGGDCCGEQTDACVPFLQGAGQSKTLSYEGGVFLVCDDYCQDCEETTCLEFVSDLTCSGTDKTYTVKRLAWSDTGFLVSDASCSGSGGTLTTCQQFVEAETCSGNNLVVTKKFFVWSSGGFTVADDACPDDTCCYTAADAVADVGAVLTDTATVNLTGTPTAISAAVTTQMSVTYDASGIKLSGDASTPGNSKYYGTDGSGTKGYYSLTSGVTSVTGTANQITVTGTTTPTLSLAGPHNYTTLTNHGILLGQATSAVVATTAMSNGQVLVGADNADPMPRSIVGDVSLASDGTATIISADDANAGKIEIATQSEMESASSTTLAVTPGRAKYHPGVCKAWLIMDASSGTPTVGASYNVSSITDRGVGLYTANFTTQFSSTNYAALAGGNTPGTYNGNGSWESTGKSTSGYPFATADQSATLRDMSAIQLFCYGDQ